MTVYIVTETYRYEDENGGSVCGVFASESDAEVAAKDLRAINGPISDYDVAIEFWPVIGKEEAK